KPPSHEPGGSWNPHTGLRNGGFKAPFFIARGDAGGAAPRWFQFHAGGHVSMPRTLFDKIWDAHVVDRLEDGTCVLYIDRHLVHEVTSPQAFEGLRATGRRVRRPDCTIAVADHNIPTEDHAGGIHEPESKLQVDTLEANV